MTMENEDLKNLIEEERLELIHQVRKLVQDFSEKTGQNVVDMEIKLGFPWIVTGVNWVANIKLITEDRFKRLEDIQKTIKFRKDYGNLNEN